MAITGVNSGDYNIFNTLTGASSSKKSSDNSSVFSGAFSNMISGSSSLSDYSLIQSGAYKKLLNAYYGRNNASQTAAEEDKAEMIKLNTANSDAAALNSSVSKLMGIDINEDNRDSLKESLKTVVENYNSVIDSASEVDTTSVLRQALWMTQGTAANAGMLEDLGVSVGENNKLTFDEEKFDKVDLNVVKSMLSGNTSFMGRLASRSSQIATASLNSLSGGKHASAYTGSGSYSQITSPETKSIIDTFS